MNTYALYVILGYGATALVLLWLCIASWRAYRYWQARQKKTR